MPAHSEKYQPSSTDEKVIGVILQSNWLWHQLIKFLEILTGPLMRHIGRQVKCSWSLASSSSSLPTEQNRVVKIGTSGSTSPTGCSRRLSVLQTIIFTAENFEPSAEISLWTENCTLNFLSSTFPSSSTKSCFSVSNCRKADSWFP